MSIQAFTRALRQIRSQDWWVYKIPPLLTAGYATTLAMGTAPVHALATMATLLVSISFVAAYGYLVNDTFDIEDDRRSGHANTMSGKPVWLRAALCGTAAAGAFASLLLLTRDRTLLLLVGIDLLLPTLYSIPPVRLKGRGIWGALADTGAACAAPTVLVILAVARPSSPPVALLAGAAGCAFFAGFRGIVTHQVRDYAADVAAGAFTWARRIGPQRARAFVLYAIFPCEVASLAVFATLVLRIAPVAAVVTAIWLVLEILKRRNSWTLAVFEPPESSSENYIPLVNNEYYEVWLPLALALQLALTRVEFALLPLFQVLAFFPNVRVRVAALRPLFVRQPARVSRPPLANHSGGAFVPRPVRQIDRSLLAGVQVIVASPIWARNGINVFAEDLVRGLQREGMASRMLLTEENTPLVQVDEPRLPRPSDIPVDELSIAGPDNWGRHWGAMQRYLQEHAPCIYIPNYDWRHSCVVSRLPDDVCVIGTVHSAEPLYFDHVRRLGQYFNAVVAADGWIERQLRSRFPALAARLATIPQGADIPDDLPARGAQMLSVLVAGLGDHDGPLPIDVARLAIRAAEQGLPIRFRCLRRSCAGGNLSAPVDWLEEPSRMEWLRLYETHDVLLSSISGGGDSRRFREVMSRGCIPILAGGEIPDLVEDGQSGFCLPACGTDEVLAVLVRLAGNPELRGMLARNARDQAVHGGPVAADMVSAYLELFSRVRSDVAAGVYRRPQALLEKPPAKVDGISVFPSRLKHVVRGVGAFPSSDDFHGYLQELEPGTAHKL